MNSVSELERVHSALSKINDKRRAVYVAYPGSAVFFKSTIEKVRSDFQEKIHAAKEDKQPRR